MRTSQQAYGSHYGNALRPERLQKWAAPIAKAILRRFNLDGPATSYPILIFRGCSGIATASAIANHLAMDGLTVDDFGMIYTRKDGERTNGQPIEAVFNADDKEIILLFCDDFIAQGTTFIDVFKKATAFLGAIEPTIDEVLLALHLDSPDLMTVEDFMSIDQFKKSKIERIRKALK